MGNQIRIYNNRQYEPFFPLFKFNTWCYKCHNVGHITRDCRIDMRHFSEQSKEEEFYIDIRNITKVWRRKHEEINIDLKTQM